MRLGDAIRKGAAMKPQAFAAYSFAGHTCAWGAALDGIGKLPRWGVLVLPGAAVDEWPWAFATGPVACPLCTHHAESLAALIPHLNSGHFSTREDIAAFVDDIERESFERIVGQTSLSLPAEVGTSVGNFSDPGGLSRLDLFQEVL